MKIIEAMKKIRDLKRKADDIKGKIQRYCCDLDFETATYPDQKAQVQGWVQSVSDILKEIVKLRVAIQRTNLKTLVKIELKSGIVEKSIAEWVQRRKEMAPIELECWMALTDKNLKEGNVRASTGEMMEVKIRRYYDPKQRDEMVDALRSEPMQIDAALEVVNAVTDLIE